MSAAPELLTVAEVAATLRIGRSLAYVLCSDGTIPSVRVSGVGSRRGRVVVRRIDVEQYLDRLFGAHTATAAPTRVDVDDILKRVQRKGKRRG